MSLIIAFIASIVLSFLPTIMCMRYGKNSGTTACVFVLNILGFFTMGILWFVAFIVSALSIRFVDTLKSIAFAIMLFVIAVACGVLEVAFIVNLLS